MSDSTANLVLCPQCGVLINPNIGHACPGQDWQRTTVSAYPYIDFASTNEYLRRIAEALEKWVNLMTPNVKVPPSKD